jgi:hypothetical protein
MATRFGGVFSATGIYLRRHQHALEPTHPEVWRVMVEGRYVGKYLPRPEAEAFGLSLATMGE